MMPRYIRWAQWNWNSPATWGVNSSTSLSVGRVQLQRGIFVGPVGKLSSLPQPTRPNWRKVSRTGTSLLDREAQRRVAARGDDQVHLLDALGVDRDLQPAAAAPPPGPRAG